MVKKFLRRLFLGFLGLIVVGYLLPERLVIPVRGGNSSDWNHQTFWYAPWGRSGVHKGIDIFANKGADLLAAVDGVVVYTGVLSLGGNVVLVLGPKWRLHYFAHLDSASVEAFDFVESGEVIGVVGDTGNAKGKPAHVHYSVVSMLPLFWRWDGAAQGWKKMFFLNPSDLLLAQ